MQRHVSMFPRCYRDHVMASQMTLLLGKCSLFKNIRHFRPHQQRSIRLGRLPELALGWILAPGVVRPAKCKPLAIWPPRSGVNRQLTATAILCDDLQPDLPLQRVNCVVHFNPRSTFGRQEPTPFWLAFVSFHVTRCILHHP